MVPARVRRLVERLLPWYDPVAEARRHERTEAIRQRSIAARLEVDKVIASTDRIRLAYLRYADGVERR